MLLSKANEIIKNANMKGDCVNNMNLWVDALQTLYRNFSFYDERERAYEILLTFGTYSNASVKLQAQLLIMTMKSGSITRKLHQGCRDSTNVEKNRKSRYYYLMYFLREKGLHNDLFRIILTKYL